MYQPNHFQEGNIEEIRAIVEQNPLATCVAHGGDDFEINHLPMLWRDDCLIGHIALANDMHRMLPNGCKAVFVFHGDNSYVSPNWYPTKAQHHKQVPTWNYQVVHMHGDLFFDHSDRAKRAAVGLLAKSHETRVNGDQAWAMRDAPREFMDAKLAEIVAITFRVKSIEAKSKLSQNKEKIDFEAVLERMRSAGHIGLGDRMQRWSDPDV